MLKSVTDHLFLPLALAFELVPLEETLTARDVCPELALLPFLTTSSCLFCGNKTLVYSPEICTNVSHTLTPFLTRFLAGATSSSSSSFSSLALPL